MNKELTSCDIGAQDSFTAELEMAVDSILNHMNDADLDRLLKGEDRTFLDQETPSGKSLDASASGGSEISIAPWWADFTSHAGTSILMSAYSVKNPDQAADRQDLAWAA